MCDCITKVETNLLNHLKEQNPTKTYEETNSFEGTGFQTKTLLFDSMQYALSQEIKVKSSFTKVNGEQSKPKTETFKITHSFCPFCGEKLSKK